MDHTILKEQEWQFGIDHPEHSLDDFTRDGIHIFQHKHLGLTLVCHKIAGKWQWIKV